MTVDDDPMLTPEMVSNRWHGTPTVETLNRWRYLRKGPKYIKNGKAIMYRLADILEYEARNTQGGEEANET